MSHVGMLGTGMRRHCKSTHNINCLSSCLLFFQQRWLWHCILFQGKRKTRRVLDWRLATHQCSYPPERQHSFFSFRAVMQDKGEKTILLESGTAALLPCFCVDWFISEWMRKKNHHSGLTEFLPGFSPLHYSIWQNTRQKIFKQLGNDRN